MANASLGNAKLIDLGQPYYPGMPHYPTHPPYVYGLVKPHGEIVLANGASSSADAIALGSHVGTHMDSLSHFSCDGRFFGGVPVSQSQTGGMGSHTIEEVGPILRRAVLFDIARLMKTDALTPDFTVTPDHLEACGVEVREGDVALIRTGWGRHWHDAGRFITGGTGPGVAGPGPGIEAAAWLSGRRIFAAGSDTVAFERVPSRDMAVHVHLLVEKGIYILECLNLEGLSAAGVTEFTLAAAPLKLRGGTGAPIRPFAILEA